MMKRTKGKTNTGIDWKKAVLSDLPKYRNRRYFKCVYDKPKIVKFKTGHKLNMDKHIFIPILTDDFSFNRSRNAQIVYPVLCSRADFRKAKSFQMSRENIAKLSGISTVAVDKGLSVLESIRFFGNNNTETPFLQREMVQDGKRRYWTYLPLFFRPELEGLEIRKWKGHYFVFHTCIIDSGIWANLSRNAKALYLAMRSKSFFDQKIYAYIENDWIPDFQTMEPEDWYEFDDIDKEKYLHRKWEVCDRPLTELFALADIPYGNTKKLIDDLEHHGLVERLHDTKSVFEVWLRPRKIKK